MPSGGARTPARNVQYVASAAKRRDEMTPQELIDLIDDCLDDEATPVLSPGESPFDEDEGFETDRWDEEITQVFSRWVQRN